MHPAGREEEVLPEGEQGERAAEEVVHSRNPGHRLHLNRVQGEHQRARRRRPVLPDQEAQQKEGQDGVDQVQQQARQMKDVRAESGRAAAEHRHGRGEAGEGRDRRPIAVGQGAVDFLIRVFPKAQEVGRSHGIVKRIVVDHPGVIQQDEVLTGHRRIDESREGGEQCGNQKGPVVE